MHGDDGFWRFFAYLNLFIFAMLNLVLAENLVVLFLGWEGVGLCSYLLIGFWYTDLKNSAAANKAFIVNRIGDFAFLLAMFIIFQTVTAATDGPFGFDFATLLSAETLTLFDGCTGLWVCLLLFIGATGKSAQIPLFVWLPDAMAGSDAGLGAHPRRDDGHVGPVPACPPVLDGAHAADRDGASSPSSAR